MFLDGDHKALRASHAGDRCCDLVTAYYEQSDCPLVAASRLGLASAVPRWSAEPNLSPKALNEELVVQLVENSIKIPLRLISESRSSNVPILGARGSN